jgi:hypothetical protein
MCGMVWYGLRKEFGAVVERQSMRFTALCNMMKYSFILNA